MVSTTSKVGNFPSQHLPGIAAFLAINAITVLPLPAQAATFLVTDRNAFAENDQLDWSSVSPPFIFLNNEFTATSQKGLAIKVNIPPITNPLITQPLIFQTTDNPGGIRTNFAKGDYILFGGLDRRVFGPNPPALVEGNGGPFTITFERPVFGAGTQIAVDDRPIYNVFVEAYDSANNLLGTFSSEGTSSLIFDNSAVFLGVRSDTANISRLVFSSSFPEQGLAINRLSLIIVPEASSSLGILLVGISGVICKLRSCKKSLKLGSLQPQ